MGRPWSTWTAKFAAIPGAATCVSETPVTATEFLTPKVPSTVRGARSLIAECDMRGQAGIRAALGFLHETRLPGSARRGNRGHAIRRQRRERRE